MLEGKFYDIQSFTDTDTDQAAHQVEAEISFFQKHAIFGGHFPGNPIVPGVCEIQIIRELCSKATGLRLSLLRSDTIKFLQVINPASYTKLLVHISVKQVIESKHDVTASITHEGTVFLKFRGVFHSIEP